MSLFKAKEWWSSGSVLKEETADLFNGSLKIAQLGPEGSGDMIIFGASDGLLQIFKPQGAYQPTDVMLEFMAKHPILQIDTGKLMPGSNVEHIAVLHPRSITVYMLISKEGHMEYGDQSILLEQYEHKLLRASYCFLVGPFGGAKNRDFICVQSLDGMLMFFEQDIATFTCFLPNVLIPGPLAYSHCADIFITCTSNWSIEAYSYYNLSHVSDAINGRANNSKKLVADWIYNVGESIISIQTLQISNNLCCFVMMGEKCLYWLHDNGIMKYMKRFDFEPVCFHAYLIGWYYENNARLMVMVVSEESTLFVYEQVTLLWSCQLTYLPLSINRAFFPSISGSLVMVTDFGEVKCCYLGTEPELFTAPPLPSSDIDFDQAQEELEKLQNIINSQSDISEVSLMNKASERELPFQIFINQNLERNDYIPNVTFSNTDDPEKQVNYELFKCRVDVNLKPFDSKTIELIQVTFITEEPLICSNCSESVANITDNIIVSTDVFLSNLAPISSLNISIVVLYTNSMGNVRVLKKEEKLPFKLVFYPARPIKESKFKITLGTDKPTVDLLELFKDFDPDMLSELGSSSGVIGFTSVYSVDSPVTIVSAKTSQRYRLQSDDLSIMACVIQQLIYRVTMYTSKNIHLRGDNKSQVKFILHGEISSEIFKYVLHNVEQHAILRQELLREEESLDTLGSQFILIQKKLMLKYREKPPTSCESVFFLLHDTHSKIITSVAKIQNLKKDIESYGYKLSSGITLIASLIHLIDSGNVELEKIQIALSTKNLNKDSQDWEEKICSNIVYLLSTSFSKSEKDRDKLITFDHNISFKNYDVKRLIKYLRLLFDRATSKNEKSVENSDVDIENEKEEKNQMLDAFDENKELNAKDNGVFNVPEGSLYGQRKPILIHRLEKQERSE